MSIILILLIVVIIYMFVPVPPVSGFAAPIGVVGPVLSPYQQTYLHSTGYGGMGKDTTMQEIYNGVPKNFRWM